MMVVGYQQDTSHLLLFKFAFRGRHQIGARLTMARYCNWDLNFRISSGRMVAKTSSVAMSDSRGVLA
jgi:hypothetical protein